MTNTKQPDDMSRIERRELLKKKRKWRSLFWFSLLIIVLAIIYGITYYSIFDTKENNKNDNITTKNKTTTTIEATTTAKDSTLSKTGKSKPETITITAGGDVLFDRKVKNIIKSEGGQALLEDVAAYFQEADIAVINLESPVSVRGARKAEKDVTFRGDPEGIKSLDLAGIDFASLANNHALDYGVDAIDDTIMLLREYKIGYSGAGRNKGEAQRLAIKELDNGLKIGFIAYSYIIPPGFMALDNRAGIAVVRPEYYTDLTNTVKEAKKKVDYLIVHFHWGMEYNDYPLDYQKKLGRLVIDEGADIVLAEHPHVIQGIEIYQNKIIAYSLGDFVFDHYSRKTGEAFILEATVNKKGLSEAKATPVYLTPSGKPQVVKGNDARVILNRLVKISKPFQTEYDIVDDTAIIKLK